MPQRGYRLAFLALLAALAAALALATAGCGESSHKNENRPPGDLALSSSILPSQVRVSPNEIGAGPAVITIANNDRKPHVMTLESDMQAGGDQPGIKRTAGEIRPGNTANLKVDLVEGEYILTTESEEIEPATLSVGPERPTSQQDLLLP